MKNLEITKGQLERLRKAAVTLDCLDFVGPEEDIDCLGEVIEKIQAIICEINGHIFEFDQCGYWQHKYCIVCRENKYPNLAKKSCRDLDKEMPGMTEKQYEEKLKTIQICTKN